MPFLRLTRDRRGFENTFLLHTDRPGDRPRLLYWYRTAPGIVQGRPPLDEDAIRTIEEQHPDIDFDWPAILALSEVMTPEDEAPARPQKQQQKKKRDHQREAPRERHEARAGETSDEADSGEASGAGETSDADDAGEAREPREQGSEVVEARTSAPRASGLLEELVGREIATRLRARHADIVSRIHAQDADAGVRDAWLKRSDTINPDLWVTPDAILEGVRGADALYDQLRSELTA